MYVKFSIPNALAVWQEKGGTTNFPESLQDVLKYIQNDPNITNPLEAAYLLGTAKAESDFSLTRWEADYVCGSVGQPYDTQPCQRALDYYRSTSTSAGHSKSNYYTLGVDSNGLPYFGRGLIQLTGKANYEKYGEMIGVDLVGNGNKALEPKNSYKIASAYLKRKTFDHVNAGDLTKARKSVNGGTNGLSTVNDSFQRWMEVFQDPRVGFTLSSFSYQTRSIMFISSIATVGIGTTIFLLMNFLPKKNKFLK